MKSINIMHFARCIDERIENSEAVLFETTKKHLELSYKFGYKNTFLLQYDAICNENYQKLFKQDNLNLTELGLWLEIVEPLTTACGLPYNSENGWKWDWHINPGFSMAYTKEQRVLLIDEAMRKFKEVFGFYPKTVASWLIDTYTINHLANNYDISCFAICRDQVNTDAYTLVGGYFNQAYYPSKCNVFTPAQSDEYRINVPVFRLLGPCPVHNYDYKKYISSFKDELGLCFTMEPFLYTGKHTHTVDWFFKTYFENEDLGFSYCQIGQENSFGSSVMDALYMQFEKLRELKDVNIETMSETGDAFKKLYPNKTPATCVAALDDWNNEDEQSVYYDCQNYVCNIFRYENTVFIRAFYLFDERVEDKYINNVCETYDAVYENLPIVDTVSDENKICGIVIDENAVAFNANKLKDGTLAVAWNDKTVIFDENKITLNAQKLCFYTNNHKAKISVRDNNLLFDYNDIKYYLQIKNADIIIHKEYIEIIPTNGNCEIYPQKY